MRISALFNRNAPNTLIGYGVAAILGLKGGQARRLVTTGEGNRRMSYAWYDVPLQDEDGRVWQIRVSSVLRTARVKNEGRNGEALGDSPGGITGPAQLDHRSRQPGPQAREHSGLARKKTEGRLPCEEHGRPRGLHQGED